MNTVTQTYKSYFHMGNRVPGRALAGDLSCGPAKGTPDSAATLRVGDNGSDVRVSMATA